MNILVVTILKFVNYCLETMVASAKLKWRTDFDKPVLIHNFEKRGWQKAHGDEDWNIYWANPWTVRQIFDPANGHRLNET